MTAQRVFPAGCRVLEIGIRRTTAGRIGKPVLLEYQKNSCAGAFEPGAECRAVRRRREGTVIRIRTIQTGRVKNQQVRATGAEAGDGLTTRYGTGPSCGYPEPGAGRRDSHRAVLLASAGPRLSLESFAVWLSFSITPYESPSRAVQISGRSGEKLTLLFSVL
jgi:hypothetical protein